MSDQHDYGPSVSRLVAAHQGRPLPWFTRWCIWWRCTDLARAYRQARALDRMRQMNAAKKEQDT